MAIRNDFQVRTHASTVSTLLPMACVLLIVTELDLPEYESYESLRSHVLTAITAGSEYFGFA